MERRAQLYYVLVSPWVYAPQAYQTWNERPGHQTHLQTAEAGLTLSLFGSETAVL
jgi:hypothetical protein